MSEIEERVTEVAPASPADLAASEPDTLVGATLQDTYTITRFMAEGGMGRVYEAEHIDIGRRCALKILHPAYSQTPDLVERLRREARAASSPSR